MRDMRMKSFRAHYGRGENFDHSNLRGVDLSHSDLTEAKLRWSNLKYTDLSYSCLVGARLYNSNLEGAEMYDADLRHARFEYANLRGADLRGADLRSATFYGADLRGADLRGAILRTEYTQTRITDAVDFNNALLEGVMWSADRDEHLVVPVMPAPRQHLQSDAEIKRGLEFLEIFFKKN